MEILTEFIVIAQDLEVHRVQASTPQQAAERWIRKRNEWLRWGSLNLANPDFVWVLPADDYKETAPHFCKRRAWLSRVPRYEITEQVTFTYGVKKC